MNRLKPSRFLLIVLLLVLLLFWVPTPFVVVQPGSAEDVKSMVQIEEGDTDEAGAFRLTTVQRSSPHANVAFYLLSFFNPHADVFKKSDLYQEGETNEDYLKRQEYNMISSQSNAIQAAYRKALIPYEIVTKEVRILGTLEDMPAADIFQVGDQILKIDDRPMNSREELVAYISEKQIGDTVNVLYQRKGAERTAEIGLVAAREGEAQPAIGVYIANVQTVEPEDESKQINITAGNIGGPSAGLIFSLEIYNRLVPENITKGYNIAGTGEINPEGQVGIIGGIQYKVVAADKAGAEIFFTPLDNSAVAQEKAEEIKTPMKIVPVGTLDEALAYLDTLPSK